MRDSQCPFGTPKETPYLLLVDLDRTTREWRNLATSGNDHILRLYLGLAAVIQGYSDLRSWSDCVQLMHRSPSNKGEKMAALLGSGKRSCLCL
jgi:hypothetical protein